MHMRVKQSLNHGESRMRAVRKASAHKHCELSLVNTLLFDLERGLVHALVGKQAQIC
jgi:hypothetical protein